MGDRMMMKKLIFLAMTFFLSSSLFLSQSLVDAAKKEKERRARLIKKSAIIVTNADLFRTDREAAPIRTPSGDKPQPVQRATPQKTQRSTPSKPTPPQQKQPTQQIENLDQMDLSVDKLDQVDQMEARGFRSDFATRILSSSEIVRNPGFALDKPDGKYADIPILGFIDLQISVKNEPGDDIAIYALHAGAQKVAPGGEEEIGISEIVARYYGEGLWYGVLGMEEQGDWVAIGKGSGTISPEKFDLGDLQSVKKVRIIFRPTRSSNLPYKIETRQSNEFLFRIDAVESLHR
jgi:hypothetical protein